MASKTVILNLRGKKFEILRETFEKFNLDELKHHKIHENEYFISRDPRYFNVMLTCVEYSGRTTVPDNIVSNVQDELAIYGLCNCTITETSVNCPKGHHKMLEDHQKICTKGPNKSDHVNCGWR